jgi:two-component system chemotaxis response regulator CheB
MTPVVAKKYDAIVIGTSAGGLYALIALFQDLPVDYPVPIIVVQHRAKDQKDLLEEVLQSKTKIKVRQADEKESISPGFVYIAPADYHLLIEKDKTFSLSADEHVHYSRPSIDVLFESAALAYRDHLVGIILTGASRDGAEGIKWIKKCGGLIIAQHPGDADYPFMPKAAIATKQVEYIWTLSRIKKFLLEIND